MLNIPPMKMRVMESMGLKNRIAPLLRIAISQIKSTKAWCASHSKIGIKLEMSGRMETPWYLKVYAVVGLIKATLQIQLEQVTRSTEVNIASWYLIFTLG